VYLLSTEKIKKLFLIGLDNLSTAVSTPRIFGAKFFVIMPILTIFIV
jgi:hypothetical protein